MPQPIQIHLSTALVLSIAAGLVLWANIHDWGNDPPTHVGDIAIRTWRSHVCGFPLPFYFGKGFGETRNSKDEIVDHVEFRAECESIGLFVDVPVALGILTSIWFFLERHISRQKLRNGMPESGMATIHCATFARIFDAEVVPPKGWIRNARSATLTTTLGSE